MGNRSIVCIAERKSSFGRLILDYLQGEGFAVRLLAMGANAVQRVEDLHPLLIIIEVRPFDSLALNICREIRRVPSLARIPLILFSSRASEEERLEGLECGADDCITELSSGREVIARVRALMRRFGRQEPNAAKPALLPPFLNTLVGTPTPAIKRGDIEIDPASMKISVRGSEVVTTNLEFRLLYYLLHNQTRVFSRDQLLDAVWRNDYVELRSVDACVRRLRLKIEPDPLRPIYIKTIRGAGYSLQVAAA